MVVTLREALELDVFKRSGPEVVSGQKALDRPLRWVHISELPDVGRLIKGGELILTTGLGLSGLSPGRQRQFVLDLHDASAAGVVVELGRSFHRLPMDLVSAARELEMPLVCLRGRMRFVEATEILLTVILSRNYDALRRAEAVARDSTELLLRGVPLKRILERLAQALDNPVILEDSAHELLESASGGPTRLESALANWANHSRTAHDQNGSGLVQETTTGNRCLWIDIRLRGELWGRLHLLQMNRRLDEIDWLALDRVAATVGMALLQERDRAQLSEGARRSLLSDIRNGNYSHINEIWERVRSLRSDIGDGPFVAIAVRLKGTKGSASSEAYFEWESQRIKRIVLDQTRRVLRRAHQAAISAIEGNQIVALVAERQGDSGDGLSNTLQELYSKIREIDDRLLPIIGISQSVSIEGLPSAFTQADEALSFGIRTGAQRAVYRYRDLGVNHLLLRLAEGPELASFVESQLQPLLGMSSPRSDILLQTLRAYVDHGGNKTETASALHLERRSLYDRLARLEEILGCSLGDSDVQFRLRLAIDGLDIIRSCSSAGC